MDCVEEEATSPHPSRVIPTTGAAPGRPNAPSTHRRQRLWHTPIPSPTQVIPTPNAPPVSEEESDEELELPSPPKTARTPVGMSQQDLDLLMAMDGADAPTTKKAVSKEYGVFVE